MSEQTCILVLGMGPLASAAARLMFLAGYSVAFYQAEDPKILRRKMSFADAWAGDQACLDGVEAQLAWRECEFLAGLRQKSFIPVLAHPIADAIEHWPWDAIVDCGGESGSSTAHRFDVPFRIGMGCGPVAGEDCDIVIATEGLDPGAVIRSGGAPRDRGRGEPGFGTAGRTKAPRCGWFRTEREIGDWIARGDILGYVGETAVAAPRAGRLVGLRRPGAAVASGEDLAEIAVDPLAPYSGVGRAEQAIARAVLFAVQMELNDWTPVELKGLV